MAGIPDLEIMQMGILTKLDNSEKWFRWKREMTLHLKSKNLWKYINPGLKDADEAGSTSMSDGSQDGYFLRSKTKTTGRNNDGSEATTSLADNIDDDREKFEVMLDILCNLGDLYSGLVLDADTPQEMWLR